MSQAKILASDAQKNNSFDKKITSRSTDYSKWYLDIIAAADLAENSPARGCMIIKPYGYALWERTQKILDEKFKETGVQNAYFPLSDFIDMYLKYPDQYIHTGLVY